MLIELTDVHKTYNPGQPNAVHALRGVNLMIREGEMAAILGRSGSGKSTLLNILGCIDKPQEGSYVLSGQDISTKSERELALMRNRSIGFVVQDFALINEQKVKDNVAIPLMFDNRYSYAEVKKKVATMLDTIGIGALSNKRVNQLSGGQKQRVAIARALVNEPLLVLADEPSGALDEQTADDVMRVFLDIRRRGHTLIIVTHDVNIAAYCQTEYHIVEGRIVEKKKTVRRASLNLDYDKSASLSQR